MQRFHPLNTNIPQPPRFTYPFCYEPHPLCRLAAAEVQRYIASETCWQEEVAQGKMFGVLVVEQEGQLGYLAAFSGLLDGRGDWPFFVPAVFDLLPPDGPFKRGEAAIEAIGHEVERLENDAEYKSLMEQAEGTRRENEAEEEAYKASMASAKAKRDEARSAGTLDDAALQTLIRESQYMKAELRRMRKRHTERLVVLEKKVTDKRTTIERLKHKRRQMSDSLQQWLFSQFVMLNSRGEKRNLLDIFSSATGSLPPSGAGECCAPKLLQYAFANGLKPVCMAEFWWGASPKAEVRHHLNYYPACRGKCKPILEYMMQGMDVDPDPLGGEGLQHTRGDSLQVVYEDEAMAVVYKPAGMLSVPGKSDRHSVLSRLREMWPEASGPLLVHRLDMDTSGLLVAAKTMGAYIDLQRQFAARTVRKTYTALLSRRPDCADSGTISLPMRPDPLDRPRQVVDREHGKEAVTDYRIVGQSHELTRIQLIPHTGRTHQLRLHCAHKDGLNAPIEGDALYGQRAERLFLHAESIELLHPITRKAMRFDRPADF